jgi:hypothetical protein
LPNCVKVPLFCQLKNQDGSQIFYAFYRPSTAFIPLIALIPPRAFFALTTPGRKVFLVFDPWNKMENSS